MTTARDLMTPGATCVDTDQTAADVARTLSADQSGKVLETLSRD